MVQQTIRQLAKGTLHELARQNYAKTSITDFRWAFTRIERYADKIGESFLSDGLGRRYMLENYGWDCDTKAIQTAYITSELRAIRILKNYEETGCIPGRIRNPKVPPACFRDYYDLHILECIDRGLSSKTISNKSYDICHLLIFLEEKGLSNLEEVEYKLIDEHLSVRSGQTPRGMLRVFTSLRCFLRCMFSNSIISTDLSFFIPSGSRYPTKPVQKLWTASEVKDLLTVVDRSDSIGKRDYAIMLLILRYGMRGSDIQDLRLTDINWEDLTIRFCQSKTSKPNTLPILDDVGWALADWITNARPKQAVTNHVFSRLTAPYHGLRNLYNVVKRHMFLADISNSNHGKSGPHSLRHALASNMLAEHVPLPVITAVLGHSSSASTMVYLHSDIEGLRQCALDIEEGVR